MREAGAEHIIHTAKMGESKNAAAGKGDYRCHKSNPTPLSEPGRFVPKFKAFVAGIKSVHGKLFLSRLGVASRSGWACLLVGLLLEYGSPVNEWMAVPLFSLVICLNIVESSIGAVLWNVVGVLIGMAQAMTIGVLVLSILGTKLSPAPTIICIFMGSFLVGHNTREMAKKVALSLIGLIFVTAHSGQNDQNLFFLVRLMVTTLIGAFCAVLTVLVPVPGLASWESRESARSTIRASSELFQSLVEAFCAKEASTFSSIFLHAKFVAKIAWADISELKRRKVPGLHRLFAEAFELPVLSKTEIKTEPDSWKIPQCDYLDRFGWFFGAYYCVLQDCETKIVIMNIYLRKMTDYVFLIVCHLWLNQVHAIWELRAFGLIPTFKRMVKGLSAIQLHLLGMTLALQSGTLLPTPGVMSAMLRGPLQKIGEKSTCILELTTTLSKSETVLLEKRRLLVEAKEEFKGLEQLIMVGREETYYKDKAEEQSLDDLIADPNPQAFTANENIKQLLRTMLPTYFFLFNLRMFFIETMNIINSGKIAYQMHQIATSGHQILTLEQKMSGTNPKPSVSTNKGPCESHTSNYNECGGSNSGCQYQRPRMTLWEGSLKWLEHHGFRLDRAQFARAFKLSLAMSMAAFAGIRFNAHYAFWANISIGFIVQQHQGGSFRMGSLRLQGTVIGVIYGYLAILVTHNHPDTVLISLIPWVTLLSYLRFTKIFGPAGVIAGLTAAIVMLGENAKSTEPIQDIVLIRITENFIGVLCLVIVEAVVWPNRAVTLSRKNIVSSLTDLRDCVANVIVAYTGNFCPEHRRMVVQGIKKLEQELRSRFADQVDLQSEAIIEPDLWNVPFPAEIYSKLNYVQGRMLDLLYFMVCSLQAATEDCLNEQIEKLVGPLQTSLVALEDEVLSSLDLLESVLQVKRHKIFRLSKKLACGDEENQLAKTPLGDLREIVGHVHPLLVLERRERNVDGTPLSMQSTIEAFEGSYEEVVCGFIAAKRENPARSLLSNSAMLSFSAVTFSLTSLLRETVELEKAVHELLYFENPSVNRFPR